MSPTVTLPTGIEQRIMCARFYDSIKTFYENPGNMRRFEEWQSKRKGPGDLPKTIFEKEDGEQ